jgi:hypothetical protein
MQRSLCRGTSHELPEDPTFMTIRATIPPVAATVAVGVNPIAVIAIVSIWLG